MKIKLKTILIYILCLVILLTAAERLFWWLLLKPRPDTDVTSAPEYNFQSFAGTVWRTKVKVAVVEVDTYNGRVDQLVVPPIYFDRSHPNYIPSPDKVIHELPVGTRLRIDRLMKDNGMAGLIRVTTSLVDGHPASVDQQRVLYLDRSMLARNVFQFPGTESEEWAVDPQLLEKAESSPPK